MGLAGHILAPELPGRISLQQERGLVLADRGTARCCLPRCPTAWPARPTTPSGVPSWPTASTSRGGRSRACHISPGRPSSRTPRRKRIIRVLKSLAKKADSVVIATDFGTRGRAYRFRCALLRTRGRTRRPRKPCALFGAHQGRGDRGVQQPGSSSTRTWPTLARAASTSTSSGARFSRATSRSPSSAVRRSCWRWAESHPDAPRWPWWSGERRRPWRSARGFLADPRGLASRCEQASSRHPPGLFADKDGGRDAWARGRGDSPARVDRYRPSTRASSSHPVPFNTTALQSRCRIRGYQPGTAPHAHRRGPSS